jgi:hypothetical protein
LWVAAPALAQVDPQRNLERIVAERSAFPSGTRVLSVQMQDERAVVELSSEAVAQGLGDEQADEMARELFAGLDFFTGIREVEVLVDGKPLWKYLPASSEPPASEARSLAAAETPVDALSLELQGKKIALHPSHGSYWNNTTRRWVRAQRTFTGPNPATRIPAGWTGSSYTPSDNHPRDALHEGVPGVLRRAGVPLARALRRRRPLRPQPLRLSERGLPPAEEAGRLEVLPRGARCPALGLG